MIRAERWLQEAARRVPTRTAIVCGGERLSWSALDHAAGRFAAALLADGFARGDRCLVFTDNRIECAIAIFGTLRAGGVFSVINPATKADKLAWLLNDCEARVLVTQDSLLGAARDATVRAPSVTRVVVAGEWGDAGDFAAWSDFLAPEPLDDAPHGIDIDLAMLVYTSGSTGRPKGVMMTHRNIVFAATSIATYLEMRESDVVLSVLPLAFDYGLYQLFLCAMKGATLVLEKSFAFPQQILPLLARERVTTFPLVPTMAALILAQRSFDPDWAASVHTLTSTAAALPPAHIEALAERFPHARIFSMYGMTESKRCTWLPPDRLTDKRGSVGIAIPGTEVWVGDEHGNPLPPDTVGELYVRGGHVMQGYWRNDEATSNALVPGRYPWERVLRTGDLFRMDEDGFLWFVARRDDMLKSRGEKVSPKEVEDVLYALPGVREAAVVGVPDPMLGQAIKAIVALDEGSPLTSREITAHCAARLEDFMVPRQIEFRDALPKSANGKILRAALQAEAEGHAPARSD